MGLWMTLPWTAGSGQLLRAYGRCPLRGRLHGAELGAECQAEGEEGQRGLF